MIEIFDDIVSKKYQDEIEDRVMGVSYKWNYSPTVIDPITKEPKLFAFSNNLGTFDLGFVDEINYNFLIPIVYETSQKSNINYKSILAARTFLQVPSNLNREVGFFHVDYSFPHLVFLYYINDSDGPTIILNKKCVMGKSKIFDDYNESDVLKKVYPKKGRVVIFDGMYYHAGGIPKNKPRCVVNFDLTIK